MRIGRDEPLDLRGERFVALAHHEHAGREAVPVVGEVLGALGQLLHVLVLADHPSQPRLVMRLVLRVQPRGLGEQTCHGFRIQQPDVGLDAHCISPR